jgi:hypothetical protein
MNAIVAAAFILPCFTAACGERSAANARPEEDLEKTGRVRLSQDR